MTIKTSDLRAFLAAASKIKTNSILPVLNSIRFDNGVITKNNLKQFVQYRCDFKGSFLIEERILSSFVSKITADEVTFTLTGNKVTISDGSTKLSSPRSPIEDYPANDEPGATLYSFGPDQLNQIRIAHRYTSDDDLRPHLTCVHMGNGLCAGTDAFIGYMAGVDPHIPKILLSKEAAGVIGELDFAEYSQNDSYMFFKTGQWVYGFIKPEANWKDLSVLKMSGEFPSFTVNRKEVIRFNDLCESAKGGAAAVCRLTNKEALHLTMKDADYDVDLEQSLTSAGDETPVFGYNARFMNRLLKPLPDDDMRFYHGGNKVFVVGAGYEAVAMGLVVQ